MKDPEKYRYVNLLKSELEVCPERYCWSDSVSDDILERARKSGYKYWFFLHRKESRVVEIALLDEDGFNFILSGVTVTSKYIEAYELLKKAGYEFMQVPVPII